MIGGKITRETPLHKRISVSLVSIQNPESSSQKKNSLPLKTLKAILSQGNTANEGNSILLKAAGAASRRDAEHAEKDNSNTRFTPHQFRSTLRSLRL
jgi:hypothetical protein